MKTVLYLVIVLILLFGIESAITQTLSWYIVDSMANAYSAAGNNLRPMAYDSATNTLAVIHRGHFSYGASSGQLWYNISRNAGNSWRRVCELNIINPLRSRYPSCTISNPFNSPDTNNTFFFFGAPQLKEGGSGFGYFIYGGDPLGSGVPYSIQVTDDGTFGGVAVWSGKDHPGMYLAVNKSSGFCVSFPTRGLQCYQNLSFSILGGYSVGSRTLVVGYEYLHDIGYIQTLDTGWTWSSWIAVPNGPFSLPGAEPYDDWWYYGGPGTFSFSHVLDANGRIHFFGVAEDIQTGLRGVVEVFETSTGWEFRHIKDGLNPNTLLNYGTLNQMGNHVNAAINNAGNVIGLVWLDAAPDDTLPDIWFSTRKINGNWSTPINISQTPNYGEILLHAAPTLKTNSSSSYTMFLGRCYQQGNSQWSPDPEVPTNFYAAAYTFDIITKVDQINELPHFAFVEQNYPNPFNPKTNIKYQLNTDSYVSLKVYDLLGNEVAVLVDENQEAGYKSIEFDGSWLPSGIYFYRINIINNNSHFMDVKKMVLIK